MVMLPDFNLRKWLGLEVGALETSGLYAWSRNPQFIGYGIFLVGLSTVWWNGYNLVGLLFYGLFVNELSRLEEAHLADVFGEA